MFCRIKNEELKNFCNCPEKYQLIDFFGAGMGTFFIIKNAYQMKKNGYSHLNAVGLGVGTIMAYIHTARFFWAEDVKTGKRKD